jgi:hypothetical protein
VFIGQSVCVSLADGSSAATQTVTKIASTMEVEIETQAVISQQVIEDTIKRGIAEALVIPIRNVVKLAVVEISQDAGKRRLRSAQVKKYEVAYEIIPPSSMNPDLVVQKANAIFVPNTAESITFRLVLQAQQGVAQIHEIMPTIPVRKFEDEMLVTTSLPPRAIEDTEDSSNTKPWVIIVSVGAGIVVLCIVLAAALLFKRKRENERALSFVTDDAHAELRESAAAGHETPVVLRAPSHTLLDNPMTPKSKHTEV